MPKLISKKVLATLFSITILTASVGCNTQTGSSSGKAATVLEPTTIKISLINEVENIDGMLEKFYEETKDTLNIKLDITGMKDSTYKQTLSLRLQSSTDIDLCFDAPWMGMSKRIDAAEYLDLEEYFNNDNYPGLKKAFSQDYLDANRTNGKLYGVPIMSTYLDPNGITYRKDLLQKYNLGFAEITSYEQLEQFCQASMVDSSTIKPLTVNINNGFFMMFANNIDLMNNNIYDVGGWESLNFPVKIVLSDEGETVDDVVFATDDDSRFTALGGKYNYNFFKEQYEKQAYWSKYTSEYSMIADPSYSEQAAGLNIAGSSNAYQTSFKSAGIEDAVVDFWAYDQVFSSDETMVEGAIPSTMQAWNFICIPKSSKNIDATIKFLDWLFSKQENMELFEYGVEGEDWKAIGGDEYEPINDKADKYTFPSYCMALNPNYVRTATTLTNTEKRITTYKNDPRSYTLIPLAGWNLDATKVSTEIAQLEAIFSEYKSQLAHGQSKGQIPLILAEMCSKFEKNGIEKVRKEIKNQAQDFINSKR